MCDRYIELLLLLGLLASSGASGRKPLVQLDGDLKLALLLEVCLNASSSEAVPYREQALVSAAVWTRDRLNYLSGLYPLKLGLAVYEICSPSDHYEVVFDSYMQKTDDFFIGVVYDEKPPERVMEFARVLGVWTASTARFERFLVEASVEFLVAAGWLGNVTVVAADGKIVDEFFSRSAREDICVVECVVLENNCPVVLNVSSPFVVFFGTSDHIHQYLKTQENQWTDSQEALFVPLDGSVPTDLPPNSYVIIPPHHPPTKNIEISDKILPSVLLLEVAEPILTFSKNIASLITEHCNETLDKVDCLRSKSQREYQPFSLTADEVVEALKIEPLKQSFVYDVYRVEDGAMNTSAMIANNNFFQPLSKVFSYHIFDKNLTNLQEDSFERKNNSKAAPSQCISSYALSKPRYIVGDSVGISFRSESWVYAFLSLSLLGVVFCISILIFLLVSIYRKDVLEGNPVLTLALLLAVTMLFCSVLPFSLEPSATSRNPLCLAKPLGVTLGYAFLFSLLLSRCILLATASKEMGFMSHIAGPVQSFLCLFIFGVQAALSLQVVGRCREVFRDGAFVYLMSYNVMLLLLSLCLCPLVCKCQRNYREGKYFGVAVVLTACLWGVWLPSYALLEDDWQEPMLCFGLIGTGAVFLGAVFIPRTYLMTIAAARDKITSALPCMAAAASTMDIYRSNTQPIYDCVNVAAINAATVARVGISAASLQTLHQPDLYSCPTLPNDEEFDFRYDTPPCSDKVTKF